MPSNEITLLSFLRMWEQELGESTASLTLKQRLNVYFRGNKAIMVLSLTSQIMLGLVDVLGGGSLWDNRLAITHIWGVYSCLAAQYFWAFRRAPARNALSKLTQVAQALTSSGSAKTKETLGRAARQGQRTRRFFVRYTFVLWASIATGIAGDDSSVVLSWCYGRSLPLWLALVFVKSGSVFCCLLGSYMFVSILFFTYIACAALYEALGSEITSGRGSVSLARSCALHGRLNSTAHLVNALWRDVLLHYLIHVLFLPAVATVEVVVTRQVQVYNLTILPIVFGVFIPLSMICQGLQSESAELAGKAYEGPWLEESVRSRRLRVLLMTRACRPASVAVAPFGTFNNHNCLGIMKKWFSFLQTLVNLQ